MSRDAVFRPSRVLLRFSLLAYYLLVGYLTISTFTKKKRKKKGGKGHLHPLRRREWRFLLPFLFSTNERTNVQSWFASRIFNLHAFCNRQHYSQFSPLLPHLALFLRLVRRSVFSTRRSLVQTIENNCRRAIWTLVQCSWLGLKIAQFVWISTTSGNPPFWRWVCS